MIAAERYFAADDVQRAIEKMNSLRDGDCAVVEAVSCGRRAIPALRALLFRREPSGIYQPRCWAAHALSMLGAHDVLFDFLSRIEDARDPVERAGDDAVINAAAQHLSTRHDEQTFELLLSLSRRRYWPGVVAALGLHRAEAIPYLVGALGEDDCRLLAEPALIAFGAAALPALIEVATRPSPSAGNESETSIRKRARALTLLRNIGIAMKDWPALRPLLADPWPRITLVACELCLAVAPKSEWHFAVARLLGLLDDAEWRLEAAIEECLMCHHREIGRIAAKMLSRKADGDGLSLRARELLLRITLRAEHRQGGASLERSVTSGEQESGRGNPKLPPPDITR